MLLILSSNPMNRTTAVLLVLLLALLLALLGIGVLSAVAHPALFHLASSGTLTHHQAFNPVPDTLGIHP